MALRVLPAVQTWSGATNATHSTNFNTRSTAAFPQLHAHQLLANQLLATASLLNGLFSFAATLHLLLGQTTTTPPTSRPLTYTAADLHLLNHNYRLPAAAASAASSAGILRWPRYIHRRSGLSHNQHSKDGSPIPSLWTSVRPPVAPTSRTANLSNLRHPTPAPPSISLALLNCRSLSNKSPIILELLLDNNIDLLFLCETWQQPLDFYALNQATPSNYRYIAKPRLSGRGGGLAVIYKKSTSITELNLNLPSISSFEYLALSLPNSITAILIYRPPKPHPSFLTDMSDLLTIASSLSSRLLLSGDFNIHVDCPNAPLTSDFLSLLDCFHLTQYIDFPTHTATSSQSTPSRSPSSYPLLSPLTPPPLPPMTMLPC